MPSDACGLLIRHYGRTVRVALGSKRRGIAHGGRSGGEAKDFSFSHSKA